MRAPKSEPPQLSGSATGSLTSGNYHDSTSTMSALSSSAFQTKSLDRSTNTTDWARIDLSSAIHSASTGIFFVADTFASLAGMAAIGPVAARGAGFRARAPAISANLTGKRPRPPICSNAQRLNKP